MVPQPQIPQETITHTLRIQIMPTVAEGESLQPDAWSFQIFLDDKPILDDATSNDAGFSKLDLSGVQPIPSELASSNRYQQHTRDAKLLSNALFGGKIASIIRKELDEGVTPLHVQLQIAESHSTLHDLPWEYVTAPGRTGGPLAVDERTPFARTVDRQTPGFRPVDASPGQPRRPVQMLVVFEEALVENPDARRTEEAVVQRAIDALYVFTEPGPLHLTLLTGSGTIADGTQPLSSAVSWVEIVNASLSAFRTKLEQYQIVHFVPAIRAEEPALERDTKRDTIGRPRFENLGLSLSIARRLPPFLVLPTEFAWQGQSGQLADFMDQGVAAILELPETASDRYWTAMQLFYERLFEHGVLDVAANQLRRFWLKNAKALPSQLPILWMAIGDGRLLAPRSTAQTDDATVAPETPVLPGPVSPGMAETEDKVILPGVTVSKRAADGPEVLLDKAQSTTEPPLEQPEPPAPAEAAENVRESTPTAEEESAAADQTPAARVEASTGELVQQPVSEPQTPAGPPPQADAPVGPPGPAGGGVTNVQVGAVNINQVVFPMERYEPPDNVMTIRVARDTVLLRFDAKDSSPTDYTSRNLLADPAYHQEIIKADLEPRRYGNLLFNAIIHNDPGLFGQKEVTTEKGWDLALQKTNQNLRIELILDKSSPDNLQMHEYRWEYLRRDARTPVALLPRSPFYRRLAQTGGPLLVDKNQQKLKVLVAICNPSAQARASFGVIGALPPINVGMEKAIATLALERLERAGLLEKRILPENPEQSVTRQMLLDAIKDGFHVLHLVCHGVFEGGNRPGDYFLAIEGAQGQLPFAAAEDVGVWMNATTKLRLVVLAACQSAVSSSGDALRGLGPRLVLNGQAPAVIAMQQKLPFPTAQLFMQSFYDDLARSGRVDMALATTRQTIFDQEGGDSGTWAIPVLFMSARDGQLIETDKDRAGRLLPPVPDIRTYRQLGASEDPQLSALNQTLANEAQAIGAQHLVSAFQRTARTALAGPAAPLATQQDRDRLTTNLTLNARVDAAKMRAFVRDATSRDKVENGVPRRVGGLELPMDVYEQITATLNKGKHIILIGAPGTGKTTLAQAICKYAQTKQLCTGATVTTATADWTTFDTVGGYVPTTEQTLEFRTGSFLQAIGKGEWLVIDEINRAEIDKAFGELFTVLSGQRVDTPYMVGPHRVCVLPPARYDENDQDPERWIPKSEITAGGYEYVVHPKWRIIGTMNVYDRSALYSLSLAFMRRFAFIDLDLPENYIDLCGEWIGDDGRITLAADRTTLQDTLRTLLDRGSVLMRRRALGPAIVRDMIGHVGERYASGEDGVVLLAEAFLLYAAPQLDGLDSTAIQDIHERLQTVFGAAAEDKHILKRIAELYPFVSFA